MRASASVTSASYRQHRTNGSAEHPKTTMDRTSGAFGEPGVELTPSLGVILALLLCLLDSSTGIKKLMTALVTESTPLVPPLSSLLSGPDKRGRLRIREPATLICCSSALLRQI